MNLKKLEKNTNFLYNYKLKTDEQERAVIDIMVNDQEEVYSPFSTRYNDILNNSLDDYIENRAQLVPLEYDLALHFYNPKNTQVDIEHLKKAIKERYTYEYFQEKKLLRKNTIFSLTMFAVGFIPFFLILLMQQLSFPTVYKTFFEVATWVFFWGAIEAFLIERRTLKARLIRKLKLINAQVKVINKKQSTST